MQSFFGNRRVVITGIGLVSPLGNSKHALWEGLNGGRSPVSGIDDFPSAAEIVSYGAAAKEFSGQINDFGELEKDQKKMIRKALKLMCRETMMGVAVAQAALQDASLKTGDLPAERSGCVYGSDYMLTMPEDFLAGIRTCQDESGQFQYQRWGQEGMPQVTPLWLLRYLPNMPASHIAIYNDLRGPNNSLTLREASSNAAVGEAAFTIARNHADMMIAGATGTRLHPMNAIHAMQQEEIASPDVPPAEASRPFDRDRTGMVLGEGAGALVLEELHSAETRGATIYGEIVSRASSTVASPSGIADRRQALSNVITAALRDAAAEPGQIGHVHAHGISTRSGDAEEAAAIAHVLGTGPDARPVTAAKSYFGNLGAGSGMVELIASLLALQHGNLFPMLNYQNPDPDCPLLIATAANGLAAGENFLNLSCTPQGQATGILIRSPT
ncbi:MAG: beta-ketoacyl-[acyl-carrier-protein] synthase family protein [Planctomycetales bacterium]|nr:beta-ketoacyl-[acyl-carrier-protein] synthase family protein [Planctomycetales bacterium]NIM08616.1 beta-ketoacyl-[acyl-carrier-protein] synthase family protein [Planctomycetales bacterium]NIN08084.1 beta-ketoacyl-[acyl-carrier-protein] synthase family protein [Planctomycetales bacterium]NIN77218.1 beta-ketoacyl-[acyl-carrier-protein] synthase family protein [Planctomycetales bacterium]NIO34400.1 beta-ketoacyl-[acyl-carrier-protein] synthase family protein [Planctomycetales bacterium]